MKQDQRKPVTVLAYAVAAMSVWYYFGFPKAAESADWHQHFLAGSVPLISAFVLFGLIPMSIVRFVFHEKLADYGLRFGILYRTVRSFLLAAPIIAFIAYCTGHQPAFFDVYPLNYAVRGHNWHIGSGVFAIHCVLYLGYYFGWEFLFRGFMQYGLSERCGVPTAVLIQTLVSTMLHYGHPASEVFGAVIAGIVWGILAFRTKSILSGFGQHALLGIVLDYVLIRVTGGA